MDQIQKTLIKMGRKDLAQKYYLKVAGNPWDTPVPRDPEQLKNWPGIDVKKLGFEKWFAENKDSDMLQDNYNDYVTETKQMGFKPSNYKQWARGVFNRKASKKQARSEESWDVFIMYPNGQGWNVWKSPTKDDARKVAEFLKAQPHTHGKFRLKIEKGW